MHVGCFMSRADEDGTDIVLLYIVNSVHVETDELISSEDISKMVLL